MDYTGVMPGGDVLRTQTLCVMQKCAELDMPVAAYVRVWCPPGLVLTEKCSKHLLTIFTCKVDMVQRYAQIVGNALCIGKISGRGAMLIGIIPVGHVQGFDQMSCALQTQGCYGGVNTAGKGNDNGFVCLRHTAKF